MNFDITSLDKDFADGLRELRADYKFGLDGNVKLTAAQGEAGVARGDNGYVLTTKNASFTAVLSNCLRARSDILNAVRLRTWAR